MANEPESAISSLTPNEFAALKAAGTAYESAALKFRDNEWTAENAANFHEKKRLFEKLVTPASMLTVLSRLMTVEMALNPFALAAASFSSFEKDEIQHFGRSYADDHPLIAIQESHGSASFQIYIGHLRNAIRAMASNPTF